ncbi:group II intron reverse transcriptase/maturase, partial [Acetoanaerobium noterae]|uniref:group II intron reverse transcriptase/maturase n=1 Tax=Acetoanaerobium noterae TaxID=745369 RepID=UPI003221D2A5
METQMERIAEIARKHGKVQTLVHHINADNLKAKHKQALAKKVTGVDGVTKYIYEENLEQNLSSLVDRMKRQAYKPQNVRRVYIPKEGSKDKRGLGIPAYEDKLVQSIMADALTAIYENKFLDFSYGFRPKRSCHDAIKALGKVIERKKVNFIVDADIKGFFDNVEHEWMMKFLENDIEDVNFLRIIKRFLKAGIMEDGKFIRTDAGTPQGGVISPILANVYLHYALDLWFDKVVAKRCKGEAYIIRYADDFVCCFQYKDEAELFYLSLKERLREFGLELADEKSKIIEFGRFAEENRNNRGDGKPETFDFLGFTHYCGRSRDGQFRVKRKTSRKKMHTKIANMKMWLKKRMHTPVDETIKTLNKKLVGHYNYYGITDNSNSIGAFQYLAIRELFK